MNDSIEKLLARTKYMTLATVSADNKPWAVPITFVHADGQLYWRSRIDTEHSINIERHNSVSIVIFDGDRIDGNQERQALYVQTTALKTAPDIQAELLKKFDGVFSIKDTEAPLYVAAIGNLDETRSTDNRFYMTDTLVAGEKQ
ncbi:hypothetical protein A2707_01955 [Candidatus Saccharibacteria bacterium RIFCSPHIGHO2_01_FULL_45_15]|nr:MAG: hypothetical protein A2707_01955 [Candidatus Saccharibacteria bacterium RIFCSPHIGHO2_01_FULL_45_15]OGL27765.1 MAG: hypothetical protein A3C39_04235 [Candidatus Saccharibacteria bacterium RIFCSPHIGHO2_02_FULL_46_12]OGL31654.1 MAG: hypothetical protein A3E76_00885 [Candidatus Saccharibacteria bacterium RIFCSPHIGHO2_12_FULL_44_22]